MSFDMSEFGKTLRDSVFATWFGWSAIMAIIIFPMTSMVSTCHGNSVKLDIEVAQIEAQNPDRGVVQTETLKWLVTRGVHPLVARCAILNSPATQCATMMNYLEDKDRSIIKELIANPGLAEIASSLPAVAGRAAPPVMAEYYTQGLDFGARSPTE